MNTKIYSREYAESLAKGQYEGLVKDGLDEHAKLIVCNDWSLTDEELNKIISTDYTEYVNNQVVKMKSKQDNEANQADKTLRNFNILQDYEDDMSIDDLCDKYELSSRQIKRILGLGK